MSILGEPRREDADPAGPRRRPIRRWLLLLALAGCVLGLVLSTQLPLSPQAAPAFQYFRETRHSVRGPFLAFYLEHGGQRIFGLPITEARQNGTGWQVQYFQRARMELHQDGRIYLGNVCEELGYGELALPADMLPPDSDTSRRFPSGHSSAYAFLSFYDRYGKSDIFGNPITEPRMVNGHISQTWQRARMEWWPQNPPDQRVVLLDCGSIYASRHVPGEWLAPVADTGATAVEQAPTPVATDLYVTMMRGNGTVRPGESQTVQVAVQDQTGRAVGGATVIVTESSRSGKHTLLASLTDGTGSLEITYVPAEPTPGEIVVVEATVTYGGLTRVVQTNYVMAFAY